MKVVAFDKTGTITKGNFAVETVHRSPLAAEKLLRMIDGERERSVNMAWSLIERDSLPRVERP